MQAIRIAIGAPVDQTETEKSQHTATINYDNGDSYTGELVAGKREGEGKYVFENGDIYDGAFEANQFSGKGVYTTDTGDEYEGVFYNGNATGFGTCAFLSRTDIENYEGQWQDNRPQGKGTLEFSAGDNYVGNFFQGLMHGKGVLTYSNGDAFDGTYANGAATGKGKMLFKDSKIVMDRSFQNGVDRADTQELKRNTHKIEKRKKKHVVVRKDTYRPKKAGRNPNSGIMQGILADIGIGAKKKKKRTTKKRTTKASTKKKNIVKKVKKKKASKVRTTKKTRSKSTKKKTTKKVTKTTKSVVKRKIKKRKPRRSAAPDPEYVRIQRTNVCGVSKRKQQRIDLEELFGNKDEEDQPLRRSKSIARTLMEAEAYLRNIYEKNNGDDNDGEMQEEN